MGWDSTHTRTPTPTHGGERQDRDCACFKHKSSKNVPLVPPTFTGSAWPPTRQGAVNVPELCLATQRSESSLRLMPARYAEAALGQREVPRFEIPNTRGQTSTHSSRLYARFALKCRRMRDHRLFMPSTMSADKADCAKGQTCSVNVWG